MTTFKAVLWTSEPHKDGRCAVKIYGKRKFYHVPRVAVLPADWDETNGKVKRTNPLHASINSVIKSKLLEIETAYVEGREMPKKQKKEPVEVRTTISQFIELYVAETAKGQHDIAAGTVKHYNALKIRLNQFAEDRGKPVYFDEIDSDFYGDFWQFLNTNFNIQKAGGFAKHIKVLKKFMNEAQKRGLHTNNAHRDKNFKVHKSKGQKIYLTEPEIEKIESLDLSSMPWLEEERDRWLICYYFLLRYQDGQDHICRDNFFQAGSGSKWYFRYDAGKTGNNATIPVKPSAMALLEKYDFKLPKTTNQESNRKIKMIASMAGINNPVQENGVKGPKCNFVRTHTARRSAATNLAMQSVPLDFIAKLGGWKKLEVLKVYLLASGLDVAAAASEYDFFK